MLLSPEPTRPIIDWGFQPREVESNYTSKSLSSISLPARFVGRRAEMRQYKNRLLNGEIQKLLITGPGGQGKTSLAGKLALDMQSRGFRVFAWSARFENGWRQFVREMSLSLAGDLAQQYDRWLPNFENETEHAEKLFGFLLQQFRGRVVILLDNLESIQDPDTREVTSVQISAWIRAAHKTQGLILLGTSRWKLPDWEGEHLQLSHANYGDFLQMAQQMSERGQLHRSFLENRPRLRHVFQVVGGNSRGLEFFAAATLDMEGDEENTFLERLAQTKSDLQANMAIETIYTRLPENAKSFLWRLPAHMEPVPVEGMIKLGLDLAEDAEFLLHQLLAVSLLEAQYEPDWDVIQYQCSPLVADWMRERDLVDESLQWLRSVADYHLYLRENERSNLHQSIITHDALRRAQRTSDADRLTLDYIVGPFTRAGLYIALLNEWLPSICQSEDLQVRGEALGQTGKLLHHIGDFENALPFMQQSLAIQQQIGDKAGEGATLNNISQVFKAQGDYETALSYLKQSLAIQRQIGDKAGLCATLFNMGHIHLQNEQPQDAVSAWLTVYRIAKEINLAQALQALANLAPQLGLPEGLEGWENLAQRIQNGEKIQFEDKEEVNELEQIRRFVTGLVNAVQEKSPEAQKYFESVSKMAVDPKAPPHYQALGHVLRKYMSGVKNPDLSGLPKEIAEIVQKEIWEE